MLLTACNGRSCACTVFVRGQKNIKISLGALFLFLFFFFLSSSSLIIHAARVHVIPGLRQSCEEMCRLIISYQILNGSVQPEESILASVPDNLCKISI